MAYMNQDKKAQLAPLVKAVCKKYGVKGTLSVRHHSGIVLTISEGSLDFLKGEDTYRQIYQYALDRYEGTIRNFLEEVNEALNTGNYDRSDIMSDYFDVGWYTYINIGKYDKPYRLVKSGDITMNNQKIVKGHIFPAGKYYIGDLCYVIVQAWPEVCDSAVTSSAIQLNDGRIIQLSPTEYGDGLYYDDERRDYPVDSGTIGVVSVDDIREDGLSGIRFGNVVDMKKPFTLTCENGTISVGDIQIYTKDDPFENEEHMDEFEDDEFDDNY